MSEGEGEAPPRGDVELLAFAEIETAVLEMEIAVADAAAVNAQQDLAALGSGRLACVLTSARP